MNQLGVDANAVCTKSSGVIGGARAAPRIPTHLSGKSSFFLQSLTSVGDSKLLEARGYNEFNNYVIVFLRE